MRIIADTHTHSIACDHAYSTIRDNTEVAAQKGLRFLAVTEHTPALPGAPTFLHFGNLRKLPRFLSGVMLLKGAEVNILDYDGSLDLNHTILDQLEWVIASLHSPVIPPGSSIEHTRTWMRIAENPLVDVIGHCGDGRYPFELKPVVRAFKDCGKIVEINAHSFRGRPGSVETCRKVAELCAEYEVPVVTSSDAHFADDVGNVQMSLDMLEEIGFPQELVLNADYDRFLQAACKVSGKQLDQEQLPSNSSSQ